MKENPGIISKKLSFIFIFLLIALLGVCVYKVESTSKSTEPVEIWHGSRDKKRIALTFDAGNAPGNLTPKILDILAKENIKATFFLSGKCVLFHPVQAKEIVKKGHELGNHSLLHPRMTELSKKEIETELLATDYIVKKITGKDTKPYFRPPHGDCNEVVKEVATENGFQTIFWSINPNDWKKSATSESILNTVLTNPQNGDIIVMHMMNEATVEALPEIISGLKEQGFEIVPLSKVLKK